MTVSFPGPPTWAIFAYSQSQKKPKTFSHLVFALANLVMWAILDFRRDLRRGLSLEVSMYDFKRYNISPWVGWLFCNSILFWVYLMLPLVQSMPVPSHLVLSLRSFNNTPNYKPVFHSSRIWLELVSLVNIYRIMFSIFASWYYHEVRGLQTMSLLKKHPLVLAAH